MCRSKVQWWVGAPSMAVVKICVNYPAIGNIMSCVFEGGLVDFDTACRLESRYFANCVVSPVSKNMIGSLWFQLNAINKGKSRPEGLGRAKIDKLGSPGDIRRASGWERVRAAL